MFQTFQATTSPDTGADRLSALRDQMLEHGVAGFLVPRGDAHMGENVAPRDERLAWLTGFTGSAGLAVALRDTAAVFVDGRYTLQVADQVDTEAFQTASLLDDGPIHWIAEQLPQGGRIGYDPWLHTRDELDRFADALEDRQVSLVPCPNLIDRVWRDQPDAPKGAVRIHPDDLAGRSHADKRAEIADALREAGVSAMVLTLPESIAWLLNIRGADIERTPVPHAFAIIGSDAAVTLFCDDAKLDADLRAHLGPDVAVAPPDGFGAALAALAGPVGVDPKSAPVWVADRLGEGSAEQVDLADPCALPRARKTEAEISGARAAHLRDGAAMVRFLHWLDTGAGDGPRTEIDIATALEGFRADTGVLEDISFETISGSGPNGAIVHYRVTEDSNRTLAENDVLLVDSGAQYRDGTTDITRTMAIGTPPPEACRAFTLVLAGMIDMSRLRWPAGLAGRDLDAVARRPLWSAGLDYDHGTGHGVGAYLGVHEGPQGLSRRSTVPLEPGMILSNEPGYYKTGAFGIRIENLLVVTPPAPVDGGDRDMLGFETLTLVPIDRRMILPALLTAEQRAWLDAYHARVLAEVGPQVDGAVRDWLEASCAPV
ncbi:aminopeptidase P family protein [Oceanomicrobium pacificus]|uniref:M24 family metallopeptidase n=1 Tax=Oceanomicrobium pacificus TaxID=2692916 RepID=A0A6B0TW28_9RHOB|nr:aminopeptidase P family protein [Oceanomicrobium pacificus]MXU65442.1 M24 family metallopeptidase [Oceanomicrobium pacificus]